MARRKIIEINRDLCDGCGLCTTACAEGALELDEENKARLVREIYCDGLGACLDVCPTGALKIVEREGEGYDSRATYAHVLETRGQQAASQVHGAGGAGHRGGCPGSRAQVITPSASPGVSSNREAAGSELSQWPIQLHLISPHAPYFDHSDLLVAADCTAFALGGFHPDLLKGKKLIIACPKLDDTAPYLEKLTELLRCNHIKSLTVARMVVPCCSGLKHLVNKAVKRSGRTLPVQEVVVGIDGQILDSAA